jgi:transcription elongation GreA/GreB family factor
MSRAFVKEADGAEFFEELPERIVSPHRNFVTAEGLAQIEQEIERLRAALAAAKEIRDRAAIARISRDLKYWTSRRASAELVPPVQGRDTVGFGSKVSLVRDDGRQQTFRLVGEDEADPARGRISYVSPLARALVGRRVGDVVTAGQGEAEIVAVV